MVINCCLIKAKGFQRYTRKERKHMYSCFLFLITKTSWTSTANQNANRHYRVLFCVFERQPLSKLLYTALVQSLLDYARVAWGEISQKDVAKSFSAYKTMRLELLFERKLQKTLAEFNWFILACRRKRHKCTLVFKCLNILVTKYLTQSFTRPNRAFHDNANRRSNDLHPPIPKHYIGKKAFYAKTICFNVLPACIKSAPSLTNFNSLIIKHFFVISILWKSMYFLFYQHILHETTITTWY